MVPWPQPGETTPAPRFDLPSAGVAQRLSDGAAAFGATLALGEGAVVAASTALVVVAVFAPGLYRARLHLQALTIIAPLALRTVTAVLVVGAVLGPARSLGDALVGAGITAMVVAGGRAVTVGLVASARRRRLVAHRTLLAGGAAEAGAVANLLADRPEYGLRPVGTWIPTAPAAAVDPGRAIDKVGARVVIVVAETLAEDVLIEVVRSCPPGIQVFVALPLPDLFGAEARDDIDMVWDRPMLRLPRRAMAPVARIRKRLVDVVIASAAIVVLAPVMVAVALAVWISLGRPVLFSQERVGLGGRPVTIAKFRTITWEPASTTDDGGRLAAEVWDPSVVDQARIGRLGRLLRATSLDELPQLFTVLGGGMSLVGPRPERPIHAERFERLYPQYRARHRVPVGLTGLSQVLGLRGDTSIEDRARFDNRYIDAWSMGLDLRILLRTVVALVRTPGR